MKPVFRLVVACWLFVQAISKPGTEFLAHCQEMHTASMVCCQTPPNVAFQVDLVSIIPVFGGVSSKAKL